MNEVDIPGVEDHLVNRSAAAASIIGYVWAAYRLNRHQSPVLMTFVSTWQLVSLASQLTRLCRSTVSLRLGSLRTLILRP